MKQRVEQVLLVFLVIALMLYFDRIVVMNSVRKKPLVPVLSVYNATFYLRKTFPLLVFIIFLASRRYNNVMIRGWEKMIKYLLIPFVFFLLFLTVGTTLTTHIFQTVFIWSNVSMIEWSSAVLLSYILLQRKKLDTITCFTLSLLSMVFGGFLYELPRFLRKGFTHVFFEWGLLHVLHPLFVPTQIVAGLMAGYILKTLNWKPTAPFIVSTVGFIVFSISYYLYPSVGWSWWVPRLPTITVMLSLITGVKK